MKILAVDVGSGTQDIMLYDSNKTIENSPKLVMPSPTQIIADRIAKSEEDLFISGETMGGGYISRIVKDHLKDHRVFMTENAARTIRDNLDFVKSLGIEIVPSSEKEEYSDLTQIEFKDVDMDAIRLALAKFDVDPNFDFLGIAVQDHGYMEGVGDRDFRFIKIREKLDVPKRPEEFAYFGKAPGYFTRINAVFRSVKDYKTTIMDSKFASVCGATCDRYVKTLEKFIVMDIGNGHTLAAAFNGGKVVGVFEHHTRNMTPDKIELFVNKLADGSITHEEVHEDHGHGAWSLKPIGDFETIVATGPRRKVLEKTDFNVYYAAPAGDVMMTGPAGLIKAIQSKY
ncbi:DUF1786 domain-containing protein [Methanobacterium sp.]|uniref:DUF1786 domain-containing protein n=1 Tax=Methanobacterium sp. TaxID=2164 RepID=UPI003C7368EE